MIDRKADDFSWNRILSVRQDAVLFIVIGFFLLILRLQKHKKKRVFSKIKY